MPRHNSLAWHNCTAFSTTTLLFRLHREVLSNLERNMILGNVPLFLMNAVHGTPNTCNKYDVYSLNQVQQIVLGAVEHLEQQGLKQATVCISSVRHLKRN